MTLPPRNRRRPARHRSRPRAESHPAEDRSREVVDLDLVRDEVAFELSTEDIVRGPLPEHEADRARTLMARGSPEVAPYIYDAMFKMRAAGLLFSQIADRFRVSEPTIYRWWAKAKTWMRDRHTSLDPGDHYARVMQNIEMRRQRLLAMLMNTTDIDETAKINGEMTKLNEEERRWMESYGYFDVFTFGRVIGKDEDSAEARAERVTDPLLGLFDQHAENIRQAWGADDEPDDEQEPD